ncbi:MAG: L,D-transpeptidase [Pacificimonas sp.]
MYRHLLAATAALVFVATPLAADNHASHSSSAKVVSKGKISAAIFKEGRTPEKLSAQILLDRAGFSPGVIDGYGGGNTTAAVKAWQKANGKTINGQIDGELLADLRAEDGGRYLNKIKIKDSDLKGGFDNIPDGMAEQAELDRLGYESAAEMFAERYHMDMDFLKAINPNADFSKVGQSLMVVRPGPAKLDTPVARIEISRSDNWLRAFDGSGNMLASYPATVGSAEMPSPDGTMEVRAIAPEAKYYFDPAANPNWGPDEKLTIAAGPNNPVGGVWIDLTKDTYGIHGSPDPALIGKTASHGCVRLTNWDARELADAVSPGTTVEFTS